MLLKASTFHLHLTTGLIHPHTTFLECYINLWATFVYLFFFYLFKDLCLVVLCVFSQFFWIKSLRKQEEKPFSVWWVTDKMNILYSTTLSLPPSDSVIVSISQCFKAEYTSTFLPLSDKCFLLVLSLWVLLYWVAINIICPDLCKPQGWSWIGLIKEQTKDSHIYFSRLIRNWQH